MTQETFDQSDEETNNDQQKYKDKDKYKYIERVSSWVKASS